MADAGEPETVPTSSTQAGCQVTMITAGMLTGKELTEKADGMVTEKAHPRHRRPAGSAPRPRKEGLWRRLSRNLVCRETCSVESERCTGNARCLQRRVRRPRLAVFLVGARLQLGQSQAPLRTRGRGVACEGAGAGPKVRGERGGVEAGPRSARRGARRGRAGQCAHLCSGPVVHPDAGRSSPRPSLALLRAPLTLRCCSQGGG